MSWMSRFGDLGRPERRHRPRAAAHERADRVGVEIRALLEQRRQRALVLDAQRIRAGQHRAPVVADAVGVTRRAAVLELGLAALGGSRRLRHRDAACRAAERSDASSPRLSAHDRIPPRIDRNAAGQTPARPGDRMPFGSIASFNVSLKRRSTKSLNEY